MPADKHCSYPNCQEPRCASLGTPKRPMTFEPCNPWCAPEAIRNTMPGTPLPELGALSVPKMDEVQLAIGNLKAGEFRAVQAALNWFVASRYSTSASGNRIDLSLFINAASIGAADVPHIVVEKLQKALDAANVLGVLSTTGALVEALEEAREVLALSDGEGVRAKAIRTPEDEAVRELCERHGYGAVMDSAARQWFKKDNVGAHTTGACAATVRATLALIDTALSATQGIQTGVYETTVTGPGAGRK